MSDCFWLSVPVQLIAWKDSSPNDLLCVEWDVKHTTHSLTHLFSCTFNGRFNFNFSSQYVLLRLTSCNTSNIVYYTVIVCHKLVLLVLVRLIAMKNCNCVINLVWDVTAVMVS